MPLILSLSFAVLVSFLIVPRCYFPFFMFMAPESEENWPLNLFHTYFLFSFSLLICSCLVWMQLLMCGNQRMPASGATPQELSTLLWVILKQVSRRPETHQLGEAGWLVVLGILLSPLPLHWDFRQVLSRLAFLKWVLRPLSYTVVITS